MGKGVSFATVFLLVILMGPSSFVTSESCLTGECCEDIECDDGNSETKEYCSNPTDVYYNGSSAAKCIYIPQLIGDRTLDLLIVEFAPQNIVYGNLYYCYSNSTGYYVQTLEEYCDNKIQTYNFLDLLNNPDKVTVISPLEEGWKHLRNHYSLFYINDYLKGEAERYGIDEIPQFEVDLKGPYTLNDLPPKTTLHKEINSYFDEKLNNLNIDVSKYDYIAIVYFNDYDILSSTNRNRFNNHAGNERVYLSVDTYRESSLYVHVLTHELFHQFGARDNYVHGESAGNEWCSMFSCCTDPEGVPNPGNYPQTKGCLMCAEGQVVIELGKEGQVPDNAIENVIVCPREAEEIGWIDSSEGYVVDWEKDYYVKAEVDNIENDEEMEDVSESCLTEECFKDIDRGMNEENMELRGKDKLCQKDYECETGFCFEKICTKETLWKKIIRFFQKLF